MDTFVPLNIAVVTVSDTRTHATDKSGQTLAALIAEAGHHVIERLIVKDDLYRIRASVAELIAREGIQAIITTGGTGITGRDVTPEAVLPLLDRLLEGFGELFRAISFREIGAAAMQSRAIAGTANGKYVFCLPGSVNACSTAWDQILFHQLNASAVPCNLAALLPRLKENASPS